jgi:hypothetical protein
MGLSYWQTQRKIILPQALRMVVPSIMNSFISTFKDTSLVTIVSLYDLTGSLALALGGDANWRQFYLEGYLFHRCHLLGLLFRDVGATASGSSAPECRERALTIPPWPNPSSTSRKSASGMATSTCFATSTCPSPKASASSFAVRRVRASRRDPLHQCAGRSPGGPAHRRRHRDHR